MITKIRYKHDIHYICFTSWSWQSLKTYPKYNVWANLSPDQMIIRLYENLSNWLLDYIWIIDKSGIVEMGLDTLDTRRIALDKMAINQMYGIDFYDNQRDIFKHKKWLWWSFSIRNCNLLSTKLVKNFISLSDRFINVEMVIIVIMMIMMMMLLLMELNMNIIIRW